ncbi:hypothetical protein AU468_10555 [Alkalispirochaeta sphaeroplastigenens]|uniref:Sugar ABC transporter substrate-binding protein n=2 Tax=Alkalispirochaeta sphaeroplastigenens TaxID=1187066 RepID=A0A2S4JI69_9SPIO|nr:hypothetical protein AU468_10555 [Alkalispirochaeta sphaeroplastigenens]
MVEITVWFGRQDFIPDDNFKSFREQYPHIRLNVDVVPLEQVLTEASMAIQAGQGPDILQTDSRRLPSLVVSNYLRPMDDMIQRWKAEDPVNYEAISSSGWDHAMHGGKLYGVTLSAGPFNHVYRKDWLSEAGLSVPETWDDVLDVARAMSDGTESRRGYTVRGPNSTVWFMSHFQAMGGEFDENNVMILDSEAGIYALTFYQTLVKEGLVSNDVLGWGSGDMRAAFITGRAGQGLIGNNIFPTIQEELEYGKEWAALPPLPRSDSQRSYGYSSLGWPHVVASSTKHPYEASLVLRYLAEHENAKSVAIRYQPTTVMSVYTDPEYVRANPWATDLMGPMQNMVRVPAHVKLDEMGNILLDALGEVMSNVDADPSEVAARYQRQLNALY